eukprot:144740_1
MAFTDVQLKIELPAPETPPRSQTQTKHTLSPTNCTDDEEHGLQRINYPSFDGGSTTIDVLRCNYGYDEFSPNSNETDSESDTEDDSVSNISNIDIDTDTNAPTVSGATHQSSTVAGLTSFPDLSYNEFDTPPTRRASESTRLSTQMETSFSRKQSILRFNTSKFTTRGHANGMFKRRSHSAVLSISDTSSLRLQATNISKTLDDAEDGKPPPFDHHHNHVPIDRHNTHNNLLLQPTPRRLSLSLSSITSEASYSRYTTYHDHEQSITHIPLDISRITPYTNTKHKIKIQHHSAPTPRTIDTSNTMNTTNTMNTMVVNHTVHSHNGTQPQLTPLMDGFEAYSGTGSTETDIATSEDLDYDDEDEEDNQDNDDRNEEEEDTCTTTTCTLRDASSTNAFDCNELELEQSIDEFFSVIDSAGIGSVTFDILKICLKLLGVDLSALQLDILLNELTHYKPSLPISRDMMHQFILYSAHSKNNTENPQITLIRTEIIVGLLSNLDTTKQTTFVHTNYTKHRKKKQTLKQHIRKSKSNSNPSKSNKSKSKSKSKSPRSPNNMDSVKRNNGNVPYIITKSRRNTRNIHGRFYSDGNIMKPAMNDVESESDSQSQTQTEVHLPVKAISNPRRKPPQIRRHGSKQAKSSSKLCELSPHSLTNLPPLPPTPLKQKKYNICSVPNVSDNAPSTVGEYDEWLLICFRNSIIDSLMELLLNDELRVYVFDDHMIAHHILGNDVLSAIEYLFECQFAFMSNGCAYLDFNGFAAGMTKSNIHFENAAIAIPLIFEQLVGLNNDTKAKKNINHSFIAEDTFVEWIMNYIRIHLTHQNVNAFDTRIDTLVSILQSFYNQMQCKYSQHVIQQQQHQHVHQKRKKTVVSNVSMNINPNHILKPKTKNKTKQKQKHKQKKQKK